VTIGEELSRLSMKQPFIGIMELVEFGTNSFIVL
jgi:hypothetical protein